VGASRPELEMLDWFKRWTGYPHEAAGIPLDRASTA
jgi:hypothetical protein